MPIVREGYLEDEGVKDINRYGMTEVHYGIIYFGKQDTAEVRDNFFFSKSDYIWTQISEDTIQYEGGQASGSYKKMALHLPSSDRISIYVDTTQSFIGHARGWHEGYNIQPRDLSQAMLYPAAIVNGSADSLAIRMIDYDLPLRLEAKDEQGEWKPIEIQNKELNFRDLYWHDFYTVDYWLLPPGNMMLTAVPILSGTFETSLRLCYKDTDIYISSNEFMGRINPEQFEKPIWE